MRFKNEFECILPTRRRGVYRRRPDSWAGMLAMRPQQRQLVSPPSLRTRQGQATCFWKSTDFFLKGLCVEDERTIAIILSKDLHRDLVPIVEPPNCCLQQVGSLCCCMTYA